MDRNVSEAATWKACIFCGRRESSVEPSPSWPFWFLPQLQKKFEWIKRLQVSLFLSEIDIWYLISRHCIWHCKYIYIYISWQIFGKKHSTKVCYSLKSKTSICHFSPISIRVRKGNPTACRQSFTYPSEAQETTTIRKYMEIFTPKQKKKKTKCILFLLEFGTIKID